MGTELTGIIDLLRVRLSPEAEIFLGSLHQSSGEIYLLFDSEAPETDRLRWIYACRVDQFDARTYLEKILIEPAPEGGVYLVSTNAALMMIAYDAEGDRKSVV